MSFNILDAVRSYLTPELISKISVSLEENDSSVNKALSGIAPIVLRGFAAKANSNTNNAKDILDIAVHAYEESINSQIENQNSINGNLFNKGLHIVRILFTVKLNHLADAIVSFAGIKKESAAMLFGFTGSLIARLLGKYVTDLNMSPTSLASFLHSQKTNIMSMLPADLAGITSLLALSKIGNTLRQGEQHKGGYENRSIGEAKLNKRSLLWILLVIVMILAIVYFIRKK